MFLEPEGARTNEIYVQGMSSSLPYDVQDAFYRTIPGLENARIIRPAYAIEYDCIDPLSVSRSLMTKAIPGLFTAGQINGTSGYEEAAGQGIIAGINAVQYLREEEPLILTRQDAYIGVLIDDLVTKGTDEPYRMMTSRAEHRLLLRQDNADVRLTDIGKKIGLVDEKRYSRYMKTREMLEKAQQALREKTLPASLCDKLLRKAGADPAGRGMRGAELLRRPEIHLQDMMGQTDTLPTLPPELIGRVETEIKYEGYIAKQRAQVEKARRLEERRLPNGFDYGRIGGLRLEAQQKLTARQPETLGQAARISGVSPADISVLLVYMTAHPEIVRPVC